MSKWIWLADRVLQGEEISDQEAEDILNCSDENLLLLLHGAFKIRQKYYGNKVKLNMIINTKSGLCPEDCGYCSQSSVSSASIAKYKMIDKELIMKGAEKAYNLKVGTYCIVASGRGPSDKELNQITSAVKDIKETYSLKICACLGILNEKQSNELKEAGVDRYNHNINTSKENHANITTTHTFEDRVNTLDLVKSAGISPCSGVIIGMKESKKDIINMAKTLKKLDADSIPINFLHAVEGTPLEGTNELNPRFCLKVLALFRYMNPMKEIRISGGREVNLRSLQPLGLYAANSIFIGDYLTTTGQASSADHKMLEDLGFEIDVTNEDTPQTVVK